MRVLFAGTPAIAVPSLEALAASEHQVEVLTNPDAPAGRGGRLTASEVKAAALAKGIVVHQPEKLDADFRARIEGRFDVLVSFAFGKIFGPKFLSLFDRGGLNVHPSLLPRWRGPSPLSAALSAGDSVTGLSIQRLALKMDCGDIVYQSQKTLDGTETTGSLTQWAAAEAPAALLSVLEDLETGNLSARPQDDALATYCHLLQKSDGRLDWSLPAAVLDARIRACNPWPGASTFWNGQPLTIWDSRRAPQQPGDEAIPPGTVLRLDKSSGILIKTGDGLLVARELQLPSRKSLDYRSFVNGSPGLIGSFLGDTP